MKESHGLIKPVLKLRRQIRPIGQTLPHQLKATVDSLYPLHEKVIKLDLRNDSCTNMDMIPFVAGVTLIILENRIVQKRFDVVRQPVHRFIGVHLTLRHQLDDDLQSGRDLSVATMITTFLFPETTTGHEPFACENRIDVTPS